MAHPAGARSGEFTATLSVEGRRCIVQALPGSALGRATGLVCVVDSAARMRGARTWLPHRILVAADEAARASAITDLLGERADWTFGAIVVLADETGDPGLLELRSPIPLVRVVRPPDRECVRRAVRLSVEVATSPIVAPSLPARGLDRRRRVPSRSAHGVPGTTHQIHHPA